MGQVFYTIANTTNSYGFPVEICPTIGSGGQIVGGGLSFLSWKYGVLLDNVINALLVNASGKIMDKNTTGDDVCWALKGGGGGSWGVVISRNIKLLSVPTNVTTFQVSRISRDVLAQTIDRWQYVMPYAEEDLFICVQFFGINVEAGTKDMNASFQGIYLGLKDQFLEIVNTTFPELKMAENECSDMSWIESRPTSKGLLTWVNSQTNTIRTKSTSK